MVRFSWVGALILGLLAGLSGCKTPPQRPDSVWDGEKLGDLVPPPKDRPPPPQFLATVYLEIHILELPADNVEKLASVWQVLSAAPIRMNSYNAFSENSFRILFGKIEMWEKLRGLLAELDSQQVTTVSMTVADNDKADLPIAEIPVARPIAFIGNDLSKQTVHVGPGILALRLVTEPIPWARGVRKLIGYPTYTLPTATAIPELQAKSRQREFYFASAAFACQMGPGDLLVLGPEQYTGERGTLGGLFFNRPDEVLFFNPNKTTPPQRRPAVRVYILVCARVTG